MSSCFDPWRESAVSVDVVLASNGPSSAWESRRARRLAALLDAAHHSPFYRDRLKGRALPALADLPPVTKPELMSDFSRWVADPRLKLADLRAFIADPSKVGQAFDGRFMVWESSGSSGEPGVFVQDSRAMAVYDALEAWRRPSRFPDPWRLMDRVAFVGATGGHFASTVTIERLRRLHPMIAARVRGFSFLQPVAALCAQLDDFRPTIVATYPSAAVMLAEEAAAGRLHAPIRECWTGGETLTPGMRRRIRTQFGGAVVNNYGASECISLAGQCARGALHLNADWAILEPVDEHHRPVPPGVAGATTLLTNLANHVQPVIRYDLGDRVTIGSQRCACGSPLPVIEVEGRCDDLLVLRRDDGGTVHLLPLALTTVLEEEGGVFDFQLVQAADDHLRLILTDGGPGAARAADALGRWLRAQGAANARITVASGAERVLTRSGKSKRVIGLHDAPPEPHPAGERAREGRRAARPAP